ncbi:hypothetical protein [Xanthomonas citri]|uniref:hypothetical protein n=1 Tax=Xanthomonas citri TaxID=346 RepID=UPI0018DDAE1F|nr:hypothetical protein [Xanthomonas citri]
MDNQAVITVAAIAVGGVIIPIIVIKGVPRILKLSAIPIALGLTFYFLGSWLIEVSGLTK